MDDSNAPRGLWDSGLIFLAVLLLYLTVHFVLRLLLPQTLELDEAEQMVLSQHLAWGYSVQPPLYTWLQWGVSQLFGPSVLSLAVLKYGLLAVTYGVLYLIVREMLPSGRMRLLAVFSLLLIPSFAWESLRDLTHSVAVTAVSVLALYSALRLGAQGRRRDYVALGVLLGLGMLSKYSFAVVAAGLLFAALSLPTYRQRLIDKRFGLTLLAALVIVLPHLIWMFVHREPLMAFIADETDRGAAGDYWGGVLAGLGSMAGNLASFLTPFWLVFLVVFAMVWRQPRVANLPVNPARRFVSRFLLIVLALLVVATVCGVERFQERWFQPLMVVLPLALFGWLSRYEVPSGLLRRYGWVVVGFAALAVVGRVGQIGVLPWFDDYTRLHLPSQALAAQLRTAGFDGGIVVADSYLTGGNLRLFYPASTVVVPQRGLVSRQAVHPAVPCLVVWDANKNEAMPARLANHLGDRADAVSAPPPPSGQVSAALLFADDRWHRLGYVILPEDAARCG